MIPMHNEAFVKGFMRYWESYLNESTEIWQSLDDVMIDMKRMQMWMYSQIQRYDSWNEFKSIVSRKIIKIIWNFIYLSIFQIFSGVSYATGEDSIRSWTG